jgi:hypothetical protein
MEEKVNLRNILKDYLTEFGEKHIVGARVKGKASLLAV